MERVDTLVLLLISVGLLWIYLHSLSLTFGVLYIANIVFRYVPCIPALSKTFITNGRCILFKTFSASNEMIMCFCLFIWFIHWEISINWTISPSLWWSQLDHGGWFFWCVLGFSLPVFYWVFLNQFSFLVMSLCGLGITVITLRQCLPLTLRYVSCMQQKNGFCFCIQSLSLCLFIG